MNTQRTKHGCAIIAACLVLVLPGHGAILATEDFEGGDGGWTGRDGTMTASHQGAVGVPASGAMQGEFGASFIPQTDAFMLDSGSTFLGTYVGLTGFTFELFALDVVPSDAALRLISGANTFFFALDLATMSVGTWTPFTVSLTYATGWQGGLASFNNMLQVAGVDQVELQLTTSGNSAQTFYFDDFATTQDDLGGGDPASAVPEPSSVSMMMLIGCALMFLRKGGLLLTVSRGGHP